MSENIIAVALPWHDGPRTALVGYPTPLAPGSVLHPCADCGQVLAVGPATAVALAAEPSIVLCCPVCGVARCGQAGTVVEINLRQCGPVH